MMFMVVEHQTNPANEKVPYGFCACGCGEATGIAQSRNAKYGYEKGQHKNWIHGHCGASTKTPHDYYEIRENGCWQWTGHINKSTGYGLVQAKRYGGNTPAHRWFYRDAFGDIPEGHDIDHLCRNRACVNPDHLEAVTRQENLRRGDGTKLDAEKVRAIRQAAGDKTSVLAERFGVSTRTIYAVRNGHVWSDVCPPRS